VTILTVTHQTKEGSRLLDMAKETEDKLIAIALEIVSGRIIVVARRKQRRERRGQKRGNYNGSLKRSLLVFYLINIKVCTTLPKKLQEGMYMYRTFI